MTWQALVGEGRTGRDVRLMCQRAELERVRRGVYAQPLNLDQRQHHRRLALATVPLLHPDSVLSHATAGVLHQLPLRSGLLGRVHVTRDIGRRTRTTPNLVVHGADLHPDDLIMLDDLRVTSLARTAADLARGEPFEWGVIAADAALRLGVEASALELQRTRASGLRGCGQLAKVVEFADARAESPAESMSRVQIARAGLPMPVLQHPIVDAAGRVIGFGDFAWPEFGVIGEVDGKVKYGELLRPGETAADAVMREKRRDEDARQAGWWMVHWGWAEARNRDVLARLISNALWPKQRRA